MIGLWGLVALQVKEPVAFRAVFEDRPKQLIVRAAGKAQDGLYYVFSPDTCSVRKIWKGGIEYRGKVYDFSQENSYAKGKTLFEVNSQILSSSNFSDAGNKPWVFEKEGKSIVSTPFSMNHWGPIYLSFEEKGDTGSFEIDVFREGEHAINYMSSNTILGPNVWQWNYKQIPHDPDPKDVRKNEEWKIRFKSGKITAPKQLQNIRLFGDKMVWMANHRHPLECKYLGYKISNGVTKISSKVGDLQVDFWMVPTSQGYTMNYEFDHPNMNVGANLELGLGSGEGSICSEPGTYPFKGGTVVFGKTGLYSFEVKL